MHVVRLSRVWKNPTRHVATGDRNDPRRQKARSEPARPPRNLFCTTVRIIEGHPMEDNALWIPLVLALVLAPAISTRADVKSDGIPITVRPFTLASTVSELAGRAVRVP